MPINVMESSGSPYGQPASAPAPERRGEPRIGCHKKIQIFPAAHLQHHHSIQVELIDAAAQGIGIIHTRPMQVGEQFVLRLQFDDGARLLIFTVRHSQWLSLQRYQIGAEFSGFLAVPSRLDGGMILGALLALEG